MTKIIDLSGIYGFNRESIQNSGSALPPFSTGECNVLLNIFS
ncbi:hypothetical protein [Peribacillus huizhouensis]|uniref:Uncharacterized protein n=1 Tax=Peribacillus huizhouensis TaxID=1501239 RepID=A0ABR6CRL1_9BACI|nr:hypothetical protein [Peribacillus huizhouensis]MBA9027668.1 hypothetical protein [Peribacillus huizhouensis]